MLTLFILHYDHRKKKKQKDTHKIAVLLFFFILHYMYPQKGAIKENNSSLKKQAFT